MRAVNLLPRDDRAKRTTAEQAPLFVGLGLLLVVFVVLSVMFLGASASVKDKRNALGHARRQVAMLPPLRLTIAVGIPTSRPSVSTSAPPELPGLMDASVWMKSS